MWRAAFIGVGMGLAMPTLSAASMASLPPQVRGVGSGSLNTMRQVGFTVGVALLVAVFTHTVAQNAQQATRTSVAVIAKTVPSSRPEGRLHGDADQERQGRGRQRRRRGQDDDGSAAGRAAAARLRRRPRSAKLNTVVAAIYRDDIAESFTWPFYAAALAALLAIIPALMTGRRLGEHEGHEEMSRAERLEAIGRAEAAEAGAPMSDE